MSRASKWSFGVAVGFAAVSVYFVHWQQQNEKKQVHQGVVLDMERQERKRRNKELFEQSGALAKALSKEQQAEEEKAS